jgi:hypothetical protein
MINNEAIQSLIRKGKTFQIPTVVATSRDVGMQSMDAELLRLAKEGLVDVDDAYAKTVDKRAFEAALGLPSPDGALAPQSLRPGATPQPQKIPSPSVPPHSDRRAIVQEPSRSLRPGDPRILGGRGERGGS